MKLVLCLISALILSLLSTCGTEKLGSDISNEFQKHLLDSATLLIEDTEMEK